MDVVLGTPFLALSDADVRFAEKELMWRSYTTAKASPTTQRVELINRKKFAAAALHPTKKIFVLHVAGIKAPPGSAGMTIHSFLAAQAVLLHEAA